MVAAEGGEVDLMRLHPSNAEVPDQNGHAGKIIYRGTSAAMEE